MNSHRLTYLELLTYVQIRSLAYSETLLVMVLQTAQFCLQMLNVIRLGTLLME